MLQETAVEGSLERCQDCHWFTAWWGWSLSTTSSLPTSSNLTLILRPTCQPALSNDFLLLLLSIFRTQHIATNRSNRPSSSYTLWSDPGPVIENWTKWRLYLLHASGGQTTTVYPQSFVQLKPEVKTNPISTEES